MKQKKFAEEKLSKCVWSRKSKRGLVVRRNDLFTFPAEHEIIGRLAGGLFILIWRPQKNNLII